MKQNEIHLIFIADGAGNYHRMGFTRNSQVSASMLKKNSDPKYRKIAQKFGVVSLFRVEAIYEYAPSTIYEYAPSTLEHWEKMLCCSIIEEVEKEVEAEEKERRMR